MSVPRDDWSQDLLADGVAREGAARRRKEGGASLKWLHMARTLAISRRKAVKSVTLTIKPVTPSSYAQSISDSSPDDVNTFTGMSRSLGFALIDSNTTIT